MPFEFFGAKKKVVIGMAHIGALPGAPSYDATAASRNSSADVLSDVRKLQAGGIDAIMFGNEFDRPYQLKAPVEGVAAMTAVIQSVKAEIKAAVRRQLSLGPRRQRRDRRRDRRAVRAGDFHRRVRLRHGAVGARLRNRGAPARATRTPTI